MSYPNEWMKKAPRGFVHAACPGCGVACVYKKGSVCDDCRDALTKWAQQKAEREAKADEAPYYTKERDYAFPHLRHELRRRNEDNSSGEHSILGPLWCLHQLVSRPNHAGNLWEELEARGEDAYAYAHSRVYGDTQWQEVRIFPVAVATALRELYAGIHDSLQHAYAEGHKEGRSLLMGLASGRITNDQFNEAAARLEKDA